MHKELQDIQQLDLEENDQELGAGELPSTPGGPARGETPFWKGKYPISEALLHFSLVLDHCLFLVATIILIL